MTADTISSTEDNALSNKSLADTNASLLERVSTKHPVLLAICCYLVLMLLFFFEAIIGDKTYASPDHQAATSLVKPLQDALWQEGVYPLWTPYIFCGMPSFSGLIYTPFAYFPHALEQIVARVVPLTGWLVFAFHYVLAGMGVFLFLRRKGASFIPALTGGFAFMLTPYLITMTVFGHGSQMMTAAYIPLALWAFDRLLERQSLRNIGIAGLVIGLMLQRAHMQIAYYGLMLLGAYWLWHIKSHFRTLDRKHVFLLLGGTAGAFLLASALAAMLYLPLREYTPHSIRGAASVLQTETVQQQNGVDFEYATQWSFSPGEMMTFLLPSFYGFGGRTYWGAMPFTDYPNYMGIVVLLLALTVFAFYPAMEKSRRSTVSFMGGVILLSLLISFGKNFEPFYRLLYDYLPYFNKFRVPVMILVLVQCAVAILAGFGMNELMNRVSITISKKDESLKGTKWGWNLLIIAALIGGALTVFIFTRNYLFEFMRGLYPDHLREVAQLQLDAVRFKMLYTDVLWGGGFVIGGMIVLALALFDRVRLTTAATLLCAIIVIDLVIVDSKLGTKFPKQQVNAMLEPDRVTQFLQADSALFRIYPAGELFGEMRWSALGFESVGGYHAAKPRLYQDFITAMDLQQQPLPELANHHIIDMMNVKYVLSMVDLPDTVWIPRLQVPVRQHGAMGQLTVYENPTVLPRAYMVGEFEVESDPRIALDRMRPGAASNGEERRFNPRHSVLLSELPELTPEVDSTATTRIVKHDLHHIEVEANCASPQILVLSDSYYLPGWQAFVDGIAVKTYQANYCFRAVCVPAGKHQIEFRYRTATFKTGAWISILALFVAIGFMIIGGKKRKTPAI